MTAVVVAMARVRVRVAASREDDGGVGGASGTSTECRVVGFQTLSWRGRYEG